MMSMSSEAVSVPSAAVTPATTDSDTSAGSAPESVFDYLVCTTFDKTMGLNITRQFPADMPLVSNQLDNLLGLVMPLNLHKFLDKEHYSLIPLWVDAATGLLSYTQDTASFVPCFLYSLSYFQTDNSYRNGTAKAVSIVTRLPCVQVFKPLLYFLLQTQLASGDYTLVESVWQNVNKLPLPKLVAYFGRLSYDERFVLSRLEQGTPQLPPDLAKLFPNPAGGSLLKTTVNAGPIPFPIQIPLTSLLCSSRAMFGSDLHKDGLLRNFLQELQHSRLVYVDHFKETPLTPYPGIQPLMVLLNAILLHRRIVLYCYDSCYNRVMDFGCALLCLFNDDASRDYPFYPILDLGTLDLIKSAQHFLIGTSNLLFKEKVAWDVYFDMDAHEIHVRSVDTHAGSEFFAEASTSSASDDRRISMIGNGIKSLFKRTNQSAAGISPAGSRDPETRDQATRDLATPISDSSSVSSLSSPESLAASRIAMWDPACFPRVNKDKVAKFLDTPQNSNFFQFGFHFQRIPYAKSIFATSGNHQQQAAMPAIDARLQKQVSKLLSEHHSDLTICMVLTNYLRSLTTNILPAFYHHLNHMLLADYRSFINDKLEDEDYVKSSKNSTSTFLELRTYIRNEKIVQPFPLNYRYSPEMTFLDDVRQTRHYAKLVFKNRQLLKLSLGYDHVLFKKDSTRANQVPGFLFEWQGEAVRYDPHYVLAILDKLIDGRMTRSWRLNGNFLLQFYKALNQILKSDKANLARLLADFFVEGQSTKVNVVIAEDGSISQITTEDADAASSRHRKNEDEDDDVDNDDGTSARTLDIMGRCYERGMGRFNKLVLIAATYQINKETLDSATKKDLLLTEFKKVLSSILNNPFFKAHMLHHLDDYMKLNINDFIDYHM